MSDDRHARVEMGLDQFLMVADALGQEGASRGVVADASLSASLFILLSVLDDQALAAERLRDVADGVARGDFFGRRAVQ